MLIVLDSIIIIITQLFLLKEYKSVLLFFLNIILHFNLLLLSVMSACNKVCALAAAHMQHDIARESAGGKLCSGQGHVE